MLFRSKTGYESVSNGILRINDPSTASGSKVKYGKNWSVNPAVGGTILARMRCLSGGHFYSNNIFVSDSVHYDQFYLKGDGMIGLYLCATLIPVETQQWHIYRLTIQNTDLDVYLDENPTPILHDGAFNRTGGGSSQLMIGSGSSQGTQDIYYDYVYWTTAGAFPPGPWQPATYTGGAQGGTITAPDVPFNQYSNTLNKIRFSITDAQRWWTYQSPVYNVWIYDSTFVWADFDNDGDVDQDDFGHFQICFSGNGIQYAPGCAEADANGDDDVDALDLRWFLSCMAGPHNPPPCQ